MTSVRRLLTAASVFAVALPAAASAHGLLLTAEGHGTAIEGRVYYSDGTAGAGEFVELRDLSEAATKPQGVGTDAKGGFRFAAVPGHSYAVIAHGEEGHTSEMRITLSEGARGRLVDKPAADGSWLPPAWMMIGALLLLSAIVALALRVFGRRPAGVSRAREDMATHGR